MASDWQYSTLSDVIALVADNRGRNPDSYSDEGIPVIDNYLIISEGRVNLNEVKRYIDELTYKNFIRKNIQEDDILITLVGNGYGKVALTPSEKCVIIQNTIGIRCNSQNNNIFLYYLLKNNRKALMNLNIGAAQPSIKVGNLTSLEFQFPPLAEQKAIARVLSTLDDKIELNRQMNETLESMAQALFKSWFVDFDPVIDNALAAGNPIPDALKAKAAQRAEQLKAAAQRGEAPSAHRELFPAEFTYTEELGWIPKGWNIVPLENAIDFLEGPGIRNWQYTEDEDGIKFINIRCIKNGDLELEKANKITMEEAYGKYKHFQLEVDDIVLSASGTLGRFAFVRKEHLPLSLNTSVIRFRPIKGMTTLYYIAGYVDTKLQWELETRASGSVQRNFGPMHLKKITMMIPPIKILDKHSKISKKIFNKRRSNLEQIECLTKLRDTLLPKLLSGELRVSEAAGIVEGV